MAANIKVELIRSGVRELLLSQAVSNMLAERAAAIASRAGSGYGHDTYKGKNRCNASVFPETKEAWKDCLDNNTLLKAVK